MLRGIVTILLFFVCSSVFGQPSKLKEASQSLGAALLQKDTAVIKKMLHNDVSYGHSNGWVETKANVVADLYNGKLTYNKIGEQIKSINVESGTGIVRSELNVDVTVDGKQIQLKLAVLQVWVKKGKDWQLLARQSTKIN
ncbi:MAG: nuclear transport factor 2 family protein [Sphingobacteriales bacterium]|nr:MAG: nuclear transport factor 2 family protein [Sphingobacteriales bacterium]